MRAEVRAALKRPDGLFRVSVEELRAEQRTADNGADTSYPPAGRFARYGEVEVFNGLDLEIRRGSYPDHRPQRLWQIDPAADPHRRPPARLRKRPDRFRPARGSGESIWDLKRHMGIVSADLHRNHRVAGSALAVVLSGLYDSIGLYT